MPRGHTSIASGVRFWKPESGGEGDPRRLLLGIDGHKGGARGTRCLRCTRGFVPELEDPANRRCEDLPDLRRGVERFGIRYKPASTLFVVESFRRQFAFDRIEKTSCCMDLVGALAKPSVDPLGAGDEIGRHRLHSYQALL